MLVPPHHADCNTVLQTNFTDLSGTRLPCFHQFQRPPLPHPLPTRPPVSHHPHFSVSLSLYLCLRPPVCLSLSVFCTFQFSSLHLSLSLSLSPSPPLSLSLDDSYPDRQCLSGPAGSQGYTHIGIPSDGSHRFRSDRCWGSACTR